MVLYVFDLLLVGLCIANGVSVEWDTFAVLATSFVIASIFMVAED